MMAREGDLEDVLQMFSQLAKHHSLRWLLEFAGWRPALIELHDLDEILVVHRYREGDCHLCQRRLRIAQLRHRSTRAKVEVGGSRHTGKGGGECCVVPLLLPHSRFVS